MKKLITIAVFAVFSATSAISASLTPVVGLSYNNAGFAGEGTEHAYSETGTSDGMTQEYGAFADQYGSIFVEIEVGDIFALGVDYVPGDIASPKNVSREGTNGSNEPNAGASSVQVDFQSLTTVYAKVNVPFLGGAYIKGGYHNVSVIVNESIDSGNTYKDTDTEGYMAAIGYNHDLGSNGLSLRAEVGAMQFDDVKADNGKGASGNLNKIQVESMWGARGTLSVVKSF
jgi:hypothetical protein